MTLKCQILDKESGETFDGCMENISANGFAFSSKNSFFAEAKGKEVTITIPDFELKDQRQPGRPHIALFRQRRNIYRRLSDAGKIIMRSSSM